MSLLKEFFESLKSADAPPAAPSDQAALAGPKPDAQAGPTPAAPSNQAGPAGPKSDAQRDLAESVTKRLDKLYGPYKLAIDQKGPESDRLQAMWKSLRQALDDRDDERASKLLDEMEPFTVVLAKKTLVEKRVADLEKLPNAKQFTADIAAIRTKIADAMKLAAAPGNDFKGAVVAMKQVEAGFAAIGDLDKMYARLASIKADTAKKVARLDQHKHKKFIEADLQAIKQEQAAALALAEPPKHEYQQAIKALGAVDKHCAAAEIGILDAQTQAMMADPKALKAFLKHAFKDRFDVDLELEDKGDTPQQVYTAVKKIYELMAQVPESHTNKNPALATVKRIGGDEGKGDDTWYQPGAHFIIRWAGDKMNIHAGWPDHANTDKSQKGLINPATNSPDPPVDPECEPTNSDERNRFNWGTLHEIAHAVDERMGFMKQKKNLDYAGWIDYGGDSSPVAKAAVAHFGLRGDDVLDYVKDMLERKPKSPLKPRPKAPKGMTDTDYNAAMKQVIDWCDLIRWPANPWDNTGLAPFAGDRMYHESYAGQWVSYKRSARKQAISGYQFRATAEWFAELYAAYHSGILQDRHPMVKNFLLDM